MIEIYVSLGIYSDMENIESVKTETTTAWRHNYPLPDDDEANKTIAMQEVSTNVRSHKSYIEEYGNSEDAQAEFDRIIEETEIIANSTNMMSDFEPINNTGNSDDDNNQGEGDTNLE